MAISDPPFGTIIADGGPDDLPRTLRRARDEREREARERKAAQEREVREREAREQALGVSASSVAYQAYEQDMTAYGPPAVSVGRFDLPFFHLMRFFLKAVFAAVPALIVLAAMLWMGAQAVQAYFPDLVKMQILILFPPN